MRRIEQFSFDTVNPKSPRDYYTVLSTRDYRLMRAVVRAAEKHSRLPHSKHLWPCEICGAFKVFNAPEKRHDRPR